MRLRNTPFALRAAFVLMMLAVLAITGCSDGAGDGLGVGDRAPDFVLPDSQGSTVALEDYAGAPALLYFHMADG